MDYEQKKFTLQVKEGVTLSRAAIREVVRKRFKIPRIALRAAPGRVYHDELRGWVFQPNGQKVSYDIADPKPTAKRPVKDVSGKFRLELAGLRKSAKDLHYLVSGDIEALPILKKEQKPTYRIRVENAKRVFGKPMKK